MPNIKPIFIFVPKTFVANKEGYIEGVYRSFSDYDAYYVTNDEVQENTIENYIGISGYKKVNTNLNENMIYANSSTNDIELLNYNKKSSGIIKVFYDYYAFKNSAVIPLDPNKYGKHTEELTDALNNSKPNLNTFVSKLHVQYMKIFDMVLLFLKWALLIHSYLPWLRKTSSYFSHCENGLKNTDSFVKVLKKEKNISPTMGHIIFAKLIDTLLGFVVIYGCLMCRSCLMDCYNTTTQELITNLKLLLMYLKGSPIGLKLNYAFNHLLARFFFYHIDLWAIFLRIVQQELNASFAILPFGSFAPIALASIGLSYQIALIIDIVSLTTFHVYCIYVYAARLYSIQVKGLVSLWRMFLGKKLNPLRGRVDSYEYSSNQLFIGILGFAILIFLLPTILMYYTVFAVFRLATVLANKLLIKLKNTVNNIPIYIALLWIYNSASLSGTVHIEKSDSDKKGLKLELTLTSLSLLDSVRTFSVKTDDHDASMTVKMILNNICTGKLI